MRADPSSISGPIVHFAFFPASLTGRLDHKFYAISRRDGIVPWLKTDFCQLYLTAKAERPQVVREVAASSQKEKGVEEGEEGEG